MHKNLIDFFENRVAYADPKKNQIEDYPEFLAMYGFINPFIAFIENMVVEDTHNYKLKFTNNCKNLNKGMTELIDKSTVTVDGIEYEAISTKDGEWVKIKLVGG